MKLLTREPGRLVLHLTGRDRNALRGLLRLGASCRRAPPRFTRGQESAMPADAAEMLVSAMAEQRAGANQSVIAWLEDGARCVAGKGGYALTMTEGEAETLLQAVNGCKVAFWETLGCPDTEDPPWDSITPEIEALLFSMELATAYVAMLVEILAGEE